LAVVPGGQALALTLTPTLRRGSGMGIAATAAAAAGRRPTIGALPMAALPMAALPVAAPAAGGRKASLKSRRRGTIAAPSQQSSTSASVGTGGARLPGSTPLPAQPPAYPASHCPPAAPLLNPQVNNFGQS